MTNEELCVLAANGDENAKKQLLENIQKYIWKIANDQAEYYKDWGIDADEFFQSGVVGALKAIPKFDPERGTKFLTYATYCILKEIKILIGTTDCDKVIKNKETDEEYPVSFTSFDDDTNDYDGETNAEYIERTLFATQPYIYKTSPEQVFFNKLKHDLLCESVAKLSSREREYISYRFGLENDVIHTRKETAEYFNLKEFRAKQIEKSAMKNIRKHFEPQWNYICSRKPDCSEEKEYIVFENFTDITAASKLYYFAHKHGLSEALEVFSGRTLKVSVPIKNEFYGIKIDELILSTRTVNILKKNKITTLGKLIAKIQNGQLRNIKNIGTKTVSEIQICVLNFCYGELDYLQKIYFFKVLLCNNCR